MDNYDYLHAQNWVEQFRARVEQRWGENYQERSDFRPRIEADYVDMFGWGSTLQGHNVWVRRMWERHPERSGDYSLEGLE